MCFTLILLVATALQGQDEPPQYVRDAVRAVEAMLNTDGDEAIHSFIDKSMIPSSDRDIPFTIERLKSLRKQVQGLRDDVMVEGEPDGVRLILVADGVAGVVFIRKNDQTLIQRGFGMANAGLGISNQLNTVFGTGSQPIVYTVAAIYLIDQQGSIKLDDAIGKYFEKVPTDKSSITIRQLMSGQSGLPDFFHKDSDWDPDLAWVDRETAESRLLSQELLFKPGTNREHSHGAFGLLAALIERVSGQSYYDFIRKSFLDPAGMTRTGEYGEVRGLSISDFAVGGGPMFVGLPNIPPNWGPTSWLIKGSGGMYSTLEDLLKFYEFLRSGKVLDKQHLKALLNHRSIWMDLTEDLNYSVFIIRAKERFIF